MPNRRRWEYKVLRLRGSEEISETRLNGFGSSGWELIAVGVQHTDHIAYMKREIRSTATDAPD